MAIPEGWDSWIRFIWSENFPCFLSFIYLDRRLRIFVLTAPCRGGIKKKKVDLVISQTIKLCLKNPMYVELLILWYDHPQGMQQTELIPPKCLAAITEENPKHTLPKLSPALTCCYPFDTKKGGARQER